MDSATLEHTATTHIVGVQPASQWLAANQGRSLLCAFFLEHCRQKAANAENQNKPLADIPICHACPFYQRCCSPRHRSGRTPHCSESFMDSPYCKSQACRSSAFVHNFANSTQLDPTYRSCVARPPAQVAQVATAEACLWIPRLRLVGRPNPRRAFRKPLSKHLAAGNGHTTQACCV